MREVTSDGQPFAQCFHYTHLMHRLSKVNGMDTTGADGEGVNVDGARGVGARGANMDWGVNAGACSGWSEGRGERHGLRGHGLQMRVWRA